MSDYLGTACSVIGARDPVVSRIDGKDAASMTIGLVNHAVEVPARLGRYGGCLTMASLETRGTMALRVAAFHPPNPQDRSELVETIESVLARYGLVASFW